MSTEDAPEILLAHRLKALKLPTLPHGNIRSSRANVPPRAWITSGSSPGWWNSN